MAAPKTVWGIDLGQAALKALRLQLEGEEVQVVDHAYIEHSKILSHPDANRQQLITEAMNQFIADHDVSNDELIVAVPGQNTLSRFTKLPPVDKKKIPGIVKYEAQQQIPFDMDEVIWDYQVFDSEEDIETEVGIFAMRRDLLRDHLGFLAQLNLEPAIVQSSPLALFNALRYDGICGEEPICILDMGAQNTDLVIVNGNSLWSRNIPLGGNNFTEVLLKTFKLSFNKAERLKHEAQKHKYARQIFQAMRPVFADLVAEVQRSIGFYLRSHRGVKISKIIAMGNAFKLPGMVKYTQQNLGRDVVRPTGFSKLSASEAPNAPELLDRLLSFGVAYGLGLQGLGLAQINSNLVPPEIAKQVIWRRKTPWFYASAACLAVAAGVAWFRNFTDQRTVEQARGQGRGPTYQVQYDQEDTEQLNPQVSEAALSVVQRGSTRNTPVEMAQDVIAVNRHLDQVKSKIESRNAELVQKGNEITQLLQYKSTWPHIVKMIHDNLPSQIPDQRFAQAVQKGPEAVQKLIEEAPEKYARKNRRAVFVEELVSEYSEDVQTTLEEEINNANKSGSAVRQPKSPFNSGRGRSGQAGGMQSAMSVPQKGFLFRFTLRTPHKDGYSFLEEAFLSQLRNAAVPGVAYVDVVRAVEREQVKNAEGRDTGRGRTSLLGDAGGSEDAETIVAGAVDPLTGELVRDDWIIQGFFAVVLGDEPEQTAAGSGSMN